MPLTISDRTAPREELERVRATRVSVSLGEMFPVSAALAMPIFGAKGVVITAMAIGADRTVAAAARRVVSDHVESRCGGLWNQSPPSECGDDLYSSAK